MAPKWKWWSPTILTTNLLVSMLFIYPNWGKVPVCTTDEGDVKGCTAIHKECHLHAELFLHNQIISCLPSDSQNKVLKWGFSAESVLWECSTGCFCTLNWWVSFDFDTSHRCWGLWKAKQRLLLHLCQVTIDASIKTSLIGRNTVLHWCKEEETTKTRLHSFSWMHN